MSLRTKLASAAVAGVLGLALTGAAAFAAFQPIDTAPATGAVTGTGPLAAAADREGKRDKVKDVLDKLVQNGTITQAQEDKIVDALRAAAGKGERKAAVRVAADLTKLAADYLGLPKDQLRHQLASGKTLGQIADATPGKSRAGLIDAVVAGATAQVDKLVAEGKITAAQADKFKAKLPERVSKLVDHTFKGPKPKPTT